MQRDLPALKRGHKSDIAEPHLGEGIKITGDQDIDFPRGSFEANLNIFGPQHQPPIARAVIRFGYAAKIESNDEALSGYLRRIDLAAHATNQQLRIEIIENNKPLAPA